MSSVCEIMMTIESSLVLQGFLRFKSSRFTSLLTLLVFSAFRSLRRPTLLTLNPSHPSPSSPSFPSHPPQAQQSYTSPYKSNYSPPFSPLSPPPSSNTSPLAIYPCRHRTHAHNTTLLPPLHPHRPIQQQFRSTGARRWGRRRSLGRDGKCYPVRRLRGQARRGLRCVWRLRLWLLWVSERVCARTGD